MFHATSIALSMGIISTGKLQLIWNKRENPVSCLLDLYSLFFLYSSYDSEGQNCLDTHNQKQTFKFQVDD